MPYRLSHKYYAVSPLPCDRALFVGLRWENERTSWTVLEYLRPYWLPLVMLTYLYMYRLLWHQHLFVKSTLLSQCWTLINSCSPIWIKSQCKVTSVKWDWHLLCCSLHLNVFLVQLSSSRGLLMWFASCFVGRGVKCDHPAQKSFQWNSRRL